MKFGLSQQQQMLQESVRRSLQGLAAEGGQAPEAGRRADYWKQLAQLGAPAILPPAASGGLGLGLLEAALVAEEIGRACVPCHWHAAGVAVPLMLALADQSQQVRDQWLPAVLQGEACGGLALSHLVASRDEAGVMENNGQLSGKSLMVTDCPGADFWLVADDDGQFWLASEGAEGLTAAAMPTIDAGRHFGRLELSRVRAEPLAGDRLSPDRIVQAARIALAAEMLGAAQYMLDRAVSYAGEREQFGRIIGSFQSIKHLCAEMVAELEPCRSLVWYAAYCWDQASDEVPMLACHVKAVLSEAAQFVARTATEVHGGIGFTAEYGLHAWFKRIGVNRQLLGGPARLRAQAAQIQGLA